MKQVLQNLRDGKTTVEDVPAPRARPGTALVRTAASLVSAGTERTLVSFAEKSLVGKARSRPDLVRQMIDKARREGLLTTMEAAFNKLDQPSPLGYSSAGTVVEVGAGLVGFQVGDRVACAGGGYAVHAEYAIVPQNLLVKMPEGVDFESGAFTTLGAIALHGFRLAQPQIGERVAVIGLGLLGLLAGQIARAAGCAVFGVDLSAERVRLAEKLGIPAATRAGAEAAGLAFSAGMGFDAVLICADAKSNDPIQLAAALARDRASVISVGAVGLDMPRKPYFEKELTFLVSRSYGPGRYDAEYEEKGRDYPPGYVRWTEGRNLAAFAELLANGKVDAKALISHRFEIERAPEAYELITGKRKEPFLGVVLTYPGREEAPARRVIVNATLKTSANTGEPAIGVLGAGSYGTGVFLPAVKAAGGGRRVVIASAAGVSARHAAEKFGFEQASSDENDVLENPAVNTVVVLTRHQHHARQTLAALRAGKHVFCEKPLALCTQELEEIEAWAREHPGGPLLGMGFNRRFAPLAVKLKEFLAGRSEPLSAQYRINAGYLPPNHWLHDPAQGGGRIIGEGCHFVDFCSFLAGEAPVAVRAAGLPDGGRYRQDNVMIELSYADGSLATVSYLANGDKSFPKERVEVFCGGKAAALDDFRALETAAGGQRRAYRSTLRQDKGHRAGWEAFLQAVRTGGPAPISFEQIAGVTQATFAAVRALESGERETV